MDIVKRGHGRVFRFVADGRGNNTSCRWFCLYTGLTLIGRSMRRLKYPTVLGTVEIPRYLR